jgi:hypothetical protein
MKLDVFKNKMSGISEEKGTNYKPWKTKLVLLPFQIRLALFKTCFST